MKRYLIGLMAFSTVVASSIALADKITITGEPIVIQKTGDTYIPATTLTTQDYYFFTVDNNKRICYKDVQPSLASIDAGTLSVRIGDTTMDLHCYNDSPEYFIVK